MNYQQILPHQFEQKKERLLQLLIKRSFKRKKIILSSGKESDFYIDCKETSLFPEGLVLLSELFLELIKTKQEAGFSIDAVCGPTLGADPIISGICAFSYLQNLNLQAVIVRKAAKGHGTGQFLEGIAHLDDSVQFAMIEDVVTTGNSMIEAIDKVQNAGFTVSCCFAIVDRLEGGREAIEKRGFSLQTLFDRSDFMS